MGTTLLAKGTKIYCCFASEHCQQPCLYRRGLLFTVVPAGFISFVPLQLLHQFMWPLFGGMVGFTLLFVAIAVGLFELGLRHYESGNLMGMQN